MGVSGCGKSTIGRLLAQRLGCEFIEGDAYHPQANVDKMARGEPLTDQDRAPWLAALRARIERVLNAPDPRAVLACSALKRAYRRTLVGADDRRFAIIHLTAPPELLRHRMQSRQAHFMPATMLDSQLAILEPPEPDSGSPTRTLDVSSSPNNVVDAAANWLASLTSTR